MVVEKFKPVVLENMSKFQIGGKPGHRPAEHLFVVKSCIALFEMLGKTLIVQLNDFKKFFDREGLRDGMDALYSAGIDNKLYRLWFQLNQNTTTKVHIDGKNVGPRGALGNCPLHPPGNRQRHARHASAPPRPGVPAPPRGGRVGSTQFQPPPPWVVR